MFKTIEKSHDLESAEEAMRDFQRQHHAIQIDAQTQGAIEIAAELQGRILAAEVELDLLEQRARPTAPEVRTKRQELDALRSKYAQLPGFSSRGLVEASCAVATLNCAGEKTP